MIENLPELALSVRQPWAWAIIHGGKDIENRCWSHRRRSRLLCQRGRIAVHAAVKMNKDEYVAAREFMGRIGVQCPAAVDLLRGGIIGSVEITGTVEASNSLWFGGPCGLVLKAPAPHEFIAAVGALGFFRWARKRALKNAPAPPSIWMLRQIEPRLVVIESPYAGDVEANLQYARDCMRDSLARGEAPIASHLLYTQEILNDDLPTERDRGIAAGLAWATRAAATVVYSDRGISAGMKAGIEHAKRHRRPIEYRRIWVMSGRVHIGRPPGRRRQGDVSGKRECS